MAPRLFVARTATAVAPVAAIPTTASHFSLWNGESAGGKTYTITSVGFTQTTSTAAAAIQQLLLHVANGAWPVIGGTTAVGPLATDGIVGGSRGVCYGAVTLLAGQLASGTWHPVGPSINTAAMTASIANGMWQNVRGLYQLPPGGLLSMAVLINAAAGANQLSVTWEEA